MALRQIGERIVKDKREFYSFFLPSGRRVETKADSIGDAEEMVARTLEINKEDLAYDNLYNKAA